MNKQISLPNYADAIERARIEEGSDRRIELRQCIRNWSDKGLQRGSLFENLSAVSGRSEGPIAILEIGNSGFPRYEYIYVEGATVRSSFKAQLTQRAAERVRALVEGLSKYDLDQLQGSASSSTDDGDCYFLTVSRGPVVKQVAVYADLNSTASGLLIRDLLSLAGEK